MRPKNSWTLQSLFTCILWNAILAGVLYYLADRSIGALNQWITPFLKAGPNPLPEDVQSAFTNLNAFVTQLKGYLPMAVFGVTGFVTFIMWVSLNFQGRRAVARTERALSAPGAGRKEAKKSSQAQTPPPAPEPQELSPQPAVQLLALLQREGRLIDFLQEDLSAYEDAQIGAAVRSIHQGCNDALAEHVELKPVFDQAEGLEVTIPDGFDSRAIRLTGDVSGNPPFKGILRHRGWRVVRVTLPQPLQQQKKDWILAPAEVEIGEMP